MKCSHESLVEATEFIKAVETHQHRKVACVEEIAYLNAWITKDQVLALCDRLNNQYGDYIRNVVNGKYIDGTHKTE